MPCRLGVFAAVFFQVASVAELSVAALVWADKGFFFPVNAQVGGGIAAVDKPFRAAFITTGKGAHPAMGQQMSVQASVEKELCLAAGMGTGQRAGQAMGAQMPGQASLVDKVFVAVLMRAGQRPVLFVIVGAQQVQGQAGLVLELSSARLGRAGKKQALAGYSVVGPQMPVERVFLPEQVAAVRMRATKIADIPGRSTPGLMQVQAPVSCAGWCLAACAGAVLAGCSHRRHKGLLCVHGPV